MKAWIPKNQSMQLKTSNSAQVNRINPVGALGDSVERVVLNSVNTIVADSAHWWASKGLAGEDEQS
jgi:hypothetical protein